MLEDPQAVRLTAPEARFDDVLDDIYRWLAHAQIRVAEFKVAPTGSGFEVEIGFHSAAEAERFRREFVAAAAR